MLKITLPANHIPERTYVLDTLFGHFLGLPYTLHIANQLESQLETRIQLENGHLLIIEDHFFSRIPEEQGYLNAVHLPRTVSYCSHALLVEDDLPVLFGTAAIEVSHQQVRLGMDVVATIFFMLSRWEEVVVPDRDRHHRFPARESVSYRHGFLHRPIVNEHTELIWRLLLHLDLKNLRLKRDYRLFLTHDVDFLYRWKNGFSMLRTLVGDIAHRRDWAQAYQTARQIGRLTIGNSLDPYDTFDWMMGLSEAYDLQSRFYWMSGGRTPHDNHYEITELKALDTMLNMKKRGHLIGFHPSYASYQDQEQWRLEKERLEQTFELKVTEGRQHYLRFEAPTTWRIWEEAGMQVDSTLGYADAYGFRSGVCYEYPVFDVIRRKKLRLLERPLIAMDVTFLDEQYLHLPFEQIVEQITRLQRICARYRGDFVLLWHNSSLATQGDRLLYQTILEEITSPVSMTKWLEMGL